MNVSFFFSVICSRTHRLQIALMTSFQLFNYSADSDHAVHPHDTLHTLTDVIYQNMQIFIKATRRCQKQRYYASL